VSIPTPLCHPLLAGTGVRHGFGIRGSAAPPGTQRPHQVHGNRVVVADESFDSATVEADAIVSQDPNLPVAVVTADCVPILAGGVLGDAVVAIHAGWRGLAAGVVESGIAALRGYLRGDSEVIAVLGPHIGACCYEVDEPVLDALQDWFEPDSVLRASHPTRPGHARISLADLTHTALSRAGVEVERRGIVADYCTACGLDRFYSFRRDAEKAGRLVHYIAPAPSRTNESSSGKVHGVDRSNGSA
jgi:YfiH family protein